jgi:hypothetical protein
VLALGERHVHILDADARNSALREPVPDAGKLFGVVQDCELEAEAPRVGPSDVGPNDLRPVSSRFR